MTVTEIEVVQKASLILVTPEAVSQWMNTNLRQFRGKTPRQVIRAGQARQLLAYLDAAFEQYQKEDKSVQVQGS